MNLDLSCVCGIDLGGTSAKIALADMRGEIIARGSVSTRSNGQSTHVLGEIVRCCQSMQQDCRDRLGRSVRIQGVGMGVPGLLDIHSGVTEFLPNLPGQWRKVAVAETLGRELNCPVRLLNDARTATLGELAFGWGRDRSDASFAFFSIGTGIGGGVVIDSQLRLGRLGAAGEIGHQTIIPDGPRCGCGNRGCLETLASGPAIAAEGVRLMRMGLAPTLLELTGGDESKVSPETMGQVADQDPLIAEAIERAATYLGIGAANVVTMLHPQCIVLGGGVSLLGALLTGAVKREITQRVGMFPTTDLEVCCSTLGSEAGILGAIELARQAMHGTAIDEEELATDEEE